MKDDEQMLGPSSWERYLKVSFLIFSLTSQGPLDTYSRKVFAGRSVTPKSIFHTLGLSVGSYTWNMRDLR